MLTAEEARKITATAGKTLTLDEVQKCIRDAANERKLEYYFTPPQVVSEEIRWALVAAGYAVKPYDRESVKVSW